MPLSILPTEPRYCRATCAVGRAGLPIAGVVEHEHAAAMRCRGRLALQQRKAPGVERLGAPVGLREKVLQALHLGALRLHHRFRAGQSRECLVAVARREQPAQVATKAAALAERTEERVERRRERHEVVEAADLPVHQVGLAEPRAPGVARVEQGAGE